MPTIHLTTGLPASGKTTHALKLLAASKGGMRRVNLDDIRAMLDDHGDGRVWTHKHEATAQRIQEQAVLAAVTGGFDVIVDNTHLTPKMPGRLKSILAGEKVAFEVHDFTDVPLDECLRRDATREKPVGEKAIRRLHARHVGATKNGWRLTAEWMSDRPTFAPYVPDLGLPQAVLCDIDGTLALRDGRGPFEFERCGEDLVNEPVAYALSLLSRAGDQIVLMSGRPDDYRDLTEAWLEKNGIEYSELWMRPSGDFRPDDIVKGELFDAHVRDRYRVRLVLDDRDRVVSLWRRTLGLPCWQVAYGDF